MKRPITNVSVMAGTILPLRENPASAQPPPFQCALQKQGPVAQ